MTYTKIQKTASLHEVGGSIGHVVRSLIGGQSAEAAVAASAAHFDGLIDSIERAGWEVARLERVRHTFDEAAQGLIRELLDSHPDMTETEERSFLEPFREALHKFSQLSQQERQAFRSEYQRFLSLRVESTAATIT